MINSDASTKFSPAEYNVPGGVLMSNSTTLGRLREGESCRILHLNVSGKMRSRLMDLGFVPGAIAECLHISSGGDPIAFLISTTVIAVRKSDALKIIVTKTNAL